MTGSLKHGEEEIERSACRACCNNITRAREGQTAIYDSRMGLREDVHSGHRPGCPALNEGERDSRRTP
jgi:hypothetical protein